MFNWQHFLLLTAVLSLGACSRTDQGGVEARAVGSSDSPAEQELQSFNPLEYVDPFIGTDGKGKTFPGATVPHGMVQLSPDNGRSGWDWIAGYFYPDNIIAGFSHTHLSGTGAGDLYDISFMPLTRPYRYEVTEGGPDQGTIISSFRHDQEQASPGYYQVYLQDYEIDVELTSGLRTGYQRYRFPEHRSTAVVRLDLGYSRNWDDTVETKIEIIDEKSIAGYRMSTGWAPDQRVYFYSEFSRPYSSYQIFSESEVLESTEATGVNIQIELDFDNQPLSEVTVRTALSSVSIENARQNMLAEGQKASFDQVHGQARQAWQRELGKVHIQASKDNLIQFYTAMYYASLAPRIFSDVNGQYKGPDGQIQQSVKHPRYDFFSLWDTFRALHPWKTIIDPERTGEMMASLKSHYDVTGRLPVWTFQGNETDMMMGYHSVPVLVDAYLKGLTDIPGEQILKAAIASATQQGFGLEAYQRLGYVPYDDIDEKTGKARKWNVSLTLEYAYDDWAIARLAKDLGKEDVYQNYLQRSQNFVTHYDKQTGFMRARNNAGQFRKPFDPNAYYPEDYCEANAWQYNFFVPQDVEGMIQLMGGAKKFSKKLDAMFSTEQLPGELPEWISGYIGQYVHGNEPGHHVPYLYQFVDQGHKTQAIVRRIMDELYTTAPDGLAGNEDAGQMSAWYLFSALGFYPVDPVSAQYVLGSPEVESATIQLPDGKAFHVLTKNQSPENIYVSSVRLNGRFLERPYITHKEIITGGELVFNMSAQRP